MRIVLGNWKYIFKNILFILPFALLPGVFFALSLDWEAIGLAVKGYFSGETSLSFYVLFRSWSLIRVDTWLGAIYGVFLVLSVAVCMALMLSLVEKHMRIGKRTFSGAFTQLGNNLRTTLMITVVYFALYELWALVTSAILYSIGGIIEHTAGAYVIGIVAMVVLTFLLVYCASIFYLWFPCLQNTGFSLYDGFRYSYHLMLNVRVPLLAAFALVFTLSVVFIGAFAVILPAFVFYVLSFLLFVFLFLDFFIRMETVYFKADRLDREDLIRSYRGL